MYKKFTDAYLYVCLPCLSRGTAAKLLPPASFFFINFFLFYIYILFLSRFQSWLENRCCGGRVTRAVLATETDRLPPSSSLRLLLLRGMEAAAAGAVLRAAASCCLSIVSFEGDARHQEASPGQPDSGILKRRGFD